MTICPERTVPADNSNKGEGASDAVPAAVPMDKVERAVADIAAGRPVVVVDDEDRENEGDIIFAAEKATPELLAFTIRWARGLICVPMRGADLDRLGMPQMTSQNTERQGTAFTVSVDAAEGTTTGISAADRAVTITRMIDPAAGPDDFVRPGHIFPLRAVEGGVLKRRGHTEAAVDLATMAGLAPAGVVCEIISDDGTMMRLPDLRVFADEHDLALISIEQLIEYRRRTGSQVTRVADTRIPNAYGIWRALGYRHDIDGTEHMALVYGDISTDIDGGDVLARVHSECLTGDVFGSQRCDCGAQLDAAMAAIAERGRGVILYLRGHEGRGIGLLSKLQAYELQDAGADTVDANLELGLPVDAREYSVAAQLLDDLGVRSVELLTNNPEKVEALARHGFGVTRVPLAPAATPHNLRYLTAKKDRMGHEITIPNGSSLSGPDALSAVGE